jgi:hypothetical protein
VDVADLLQRARAIDAIPAAAARMIVNPDDREICAPGRLALAPYHGMMTE